MLRIIFVVFSLLFVVFSRAQSAEDLINSENFAGEFLEGLILEKISNYRKENGADVLIRKEILDKAAEGQAIYMVSVRRVDKEDPIGKRVKEEGGTTKAYGIPLYVSSGKSKQSYTYEKVAEDAMVKMVKSKKNAALLVTPDFYYNGLALEFDEEKRKVYVSTVFGRTDVLNEGADKKLAKELPFKYSKSTRGLTPGDERACKGCDKFKNYKKLHDGIYLKGNKVYLKYDNFKELRSLIRKSDDAIAVDFIQKQQYRCGKPNIYNTELPSKGFMTKPMYSEKLLANNTVEGKRAVSYDGYIGKLKGKVVRELRKDHEYNVIVIQKNMVCKSITRTYLEKGDEESRTIFTFYPDTAVESQNATWQPTAQKSTFNFRVPFRVNESRFKTEDIKSILDALDEPKYIIDEIFIEAHSSIEGDSVKNRRLQEKRAQSIISEIEKITESKDLLREENIKYSSGWEIFQKQIEGNEEYAYFHDKSREEVLEDLSEPEILDKLTPLLDSQRYAAMTMNVTYDITGDNEMPYVISQMKKAIEKKDGAMALKIQKFAIKQIESGKYSYEPFVIMDIPVDDPFLSLKVNQIYLDNKYTNDSKIDESLIAEMKPLYQKAPENDFVKFNYHLLAIKYEDIKTPERIDEIQNGVNTLYQSAKVPKKYVDAINLEHQFNTLAFTDTMTDANGIAMAEASMDRVKKIFNVDGSSWQNALKLGYIFISNSDLEFALEIMRPFLKEKGISDDFIFTYISTAYTEDHNNIYTKDFRDALTMGRERDSRRFCKLFGKPYLSYQLRDHPIIEKEYCEHCKR